MNRNATKMLLHKRDEILRDANRGRSRAAIAAEHQVSVATISRVLMSHPKYLQKGAGGALRNGLSPHTIRLAKLVQLVKSEYPEVKNSVIGAKLPQPLTGARVQQLSKIDLQNLV